MLWKFGYFGKHGVQKVLGGLPNGFVVQELVKRSTGHWNHVASDRFVRPRLEAKVSRFNAAGIRPPDVVVEQGTGWHGLDLLLFHAAGARRIVTCDTTPWLREDLVRYNARSFAAWSDIVQRWCGTDPEAVEERAGRLRRDADLPWPDLLASLGVTLRVTRSMERAGIDSDSVDLFYSDSVLQFVEPGDLETLVQEARRFLKASGVSFHVIDCVDLHAMKDRRIPPLGYLGWPEPVWRLMTSRYLNYQNRLRMPELAALFARHGLPSQVTHPVVEGDDLDYARRHLAQRARFTGMTVDDIATRSFRLRTVPAAAPARATTVADSPGTPSAAPGQPPASPPPAASRPPLPRTTGRR